MKIVCALIALSGFAVMVSCQKQPKERIRPPAASVQETVGRPLDLEKAVVGKPPARISVLAPIDVYFNEPVIPPHRAGTMLDKSPFSFNPDIKGTVKWISRTQLRFTPNKPLTPGVAYSAKLDGKAAFGSQRNVNDFEFSFKTAEQEVIEFTGDFEPDTAGPNMVRFRGAMTFAQPVDAGTIRGDLKCAEEGRRGRAVGLAIQADGQKKARLVIVSEPLKRGDKGRMITFSLPKKYTAGNDAWACDMLLPEANVFKVIAHMDISEPSAEQRTYAFRFSDPLRSGADLSGYVSIEPSLRFTVSIDKKYLKVHGPFIIGQRYEVTIAKGLPSGFGTRLADDYTVTVSLANLKPELEWLSEGIYLPSDDNFKLQFKSVNVAAVRCRITEIYENNLGFFIQTNLLYDKKTRPGYSDEGEYYGGNGDSYSDIDRVGKTVYDNTLAISTDRNRWVRSELDLGRIFKGRRNAGFIVTLSFGQHDLCGRCTSDRNDLRTGDLFYEGDTYYGNPCGEGYYYRHGTKSKLLIASDIGLTVKRCGDDLHVYAVDVITARPASSLTLGLYSYQNQLVEKQTTDVDGHALFRKSGEGYYLRGGHGSGLAIIKLDQPGWEVSSFDVAGVDEAGSGVDAFMYADRGVHRPGDTVHLAAIVRMNRAAPPPDHPIALKVFNPKNQESFEAAAKCGSNGHVYFSIPTNGSDPTGNWRAELSIAGQTFSKTLKIETVKPNRLKVAIDAPDTLSPGSVELRGTLSSRYLFGTPSSGLRAVLRVDLWPASLALPAWSEFTFGHPIMRFDRRDEAIADAKLDEKGILRFSYAADDARRAPELVQAILRAEVHEHGGSITAQTKRCIMAPYRTYTGIRNPFTYSQAQTGESYRIPIVVTDLSGRAVPGHTLTVKWYVNKEHWWWDYDARSKPDFRTIRATYKIGEFTLVSGDKPVIHTFDVEDNGQHFIEVTDNQSGHGCGLFFYASSWGAAPARERAERAFLPVVSDKNVYYTGDKMLLSCETPPAGLVLLTIEQGRKILRQEIKPASAGRTVFAFDVTGDMVPNCYAVVSLIQPHGQTANDVPLRIYGVKPIPVEDASTRLQLSLDAPREIKPKERFKILVSSRAPRSATYTIAIVDEGLLDLTDFETPDPWRHYFSKRRLGVATVDNLDAILGLIYPDMDRRFSIGGDMEEQRKRAGESKVQRFRPVVLFAEPATIGPGQTLGTEFTMPNYVGSVRCMLIGSAGNSYVSADTAIPVRQPLMILSTVPRVARPGDTFEVPVSVFSMDKSIDTVTVAIAASGPLHVAGAKSAGCRFGAPGEKEVSFTVAVRQRIGAGKIVVTASCGARRASDEVDLPVTCPNPYYIRATDTIVSNGKSVTLTPKKFGIEGTNAVRLGFTRFPDIQVGKRYKDLIHYPYGCIEQTTSSAFPQLYIGSLLNLSSVEKRMVTDNVNAAIGRLSSFKMERGFSYWPLDHHHSGSVSEWGTLYAGHFLIEAKAAGYHVPASLFGHWVRHARHEVKTVRRDHRYQCYRLFLLALSGSPEQGAMNLVHENYLRELDPLSKKLLAAAFHLSGRNDVAARVDKSMTTEISTYREMDGTFGSALRDRAMIAYLSYTMGDLAAAASALRSVAKEFTPGGWYSTQEMAYALLATAVVYAKSPMTGGEIPITVSVKGGETKRIRLTGYQTGIGADSLWDREITVATSTANPLFVTLFEEGIPIGDRIQTEQKGIELTRNFYDDDGTPITLQSISQGKQFWIRYRVRSLTREPLAQLALSSLLPSGWEIINFRLEGTAPPDWVTALRPSDGTYMDLRDDRVNWFFNLDYNGEASFVVKCNPSFKGSYRLPPITVEPMYSPNYYARIAGGEVSVR